MNKKATNNHTIIIAEAGVNHNGNLEIAKTLVKAAAEAGADIVKFQTFKAEKIASKLAPKAEYQNKTTDEGESQQDMLRKLELTPEMHIELKKYCEECGIQFLSTPFELDSLEYLISIGIETIKLPSGEVTNYPLLRETGRSGLPVIMSTGMCTIEEVEEAVNTLKRFGTTDIILLHCNTQYPTPYESVNLSAMETLRNRFGVPVGYSDHTRGIEVPIAAVAMGACVIEKHFTLDHDMPGPDHKASLEPHELSAMVNAIRNIEKAIGDGHKEPTESESSNIPVVRKSIVAAKHICKGEVFTEDNLTTKRPGTGISAAKWEEVIGQIADREYSEDEMIEP